MYGYLLLTPFFRYLKLLPSGKRVKKDERGGERTLEKQLRSFSIVLTSDESYQIKYASNIERLPTIISQNTLLKANFIFQFKYQPCMWQLF